jgi:tetratricopeptide (TPR) repeat protein
MRWTIVFALSPLSAEPMSQSMSDLDSAASKYAAEASKKRNSLDGPEEEICCAVLACVYKAWARGPAGNLAIAGAYRRRMQVMAATAAHKLDEIQADVRDQPRHVYEYALERRAAGLLFQPQASWNSNWSESVLLRAQYQIVDFMGREQIREEVLDRAAQDDSFLLRVHTSPGGAGKTRLFMQVCAQLETDRGWRTGFVYDPDQSAMKEDWNWWLDANSPLFIVFDYGAGERTSLRSLLNASTDSKCKLRVVLLEREADETRGWWMATCEDPLVGHMLSAHTTLRPTPLPTLAGDPGASPEKLFEKACIRFAERLGGDSMPQKPSVLGTDPFDRPLYVLMAAYAAVNGVQVMNADDAFRTILVRERTIWAWRLTGTVDTAESPEMRAAGEAGAATTLLGNIPTGDTGIRWIENLPACRGNRRLACKVYELFRDLYPQKLSQGPDSIGGLEPDVLGEHLVWEVLRAKPGQELPEFIGAVMPGDAAIDRLLTPVTVLSRVAERHPDAAPWVGLPAQVLLGVLDSNPDARWVERLASGIPSNSSPLISLRIRALDRHRSNLQNAQDADKIQARREIAGATNDLSSALDAQGSTEDALQQATEALNSFKRIADETGHARDDGYVAMSLNNRSNYYSELGRHEEALADITEAVDIYRELAERWPERHRPDLAMSYGSLGVVYRRSGGRESGREAFAQGLEAIESAFMRRPEIHVGLAMSLVNDYLRACADSGTGT